ncbi:MULTISPECIES: KinB-signaling pathway activation protein [Paenibacillus]|uniref:KinB-signaling pathway activation protein n=1 Tax=Paenibacillus vini TaxID=1476024 RepID=A0ABQ4MII2_9BACL|nr:MULTISPECIES: KinB-signaling pathway activation protein [Paenibacillus]MBQ4901760.1 KinB-signaling pathway activation protein [Paenibacillus sp. Marseille-P2973]MDN4069342.1 KinB-signaling pathway activation protein [Paenibacillus vini]GIP55793.1 KinB-signaling pathway activation protein [Paenibacillus vini]
MNLKNWLFLFWTTLVVGAIGSLVVGLLLQWTNTMELNGTADLLVNVGILLGVGIMVSVYSQMGFFAYMMINYMGTGVFSRTTWQYIQLILAALALLELLFFRTFVGREGKGTSDLVLGILLLLIACVVAYFKSKMTNRSAWIPTLFFMIAVTIVETVGVLKIGVDQATAWIVAPLIACNAYQILILHRVLKPRTQTA